MDCLQEEEEPSLSTQTDKQVTRSNSLSERSFNTGATTMTEVTTNTTPAEIVTDAPVRDVEEDGIALEDTLQVAEVNLEEECKEEEGVRDLSSTNHSNTKRVNSNHSNTKRVNFGLVEVREYCITIGNSPYCSCGPPLSLDWEYSQLEPYDIDTFECALKRKVRSRRRLLLDPMQRRLLLWRSGHTLEDIDNATKQNEKEKFRQSVNLFFLPVHMVQEFFAAQSEKFRGKQRSRESERTMVEAQVRQLHQRQLADVDTEHGGLTPWQQEMRQRQRPERRLSFRRSGSQASLRQGLSQTSQQSASQQSDGESSGGGPGIPDLSSRPSMDEDEASMGSTQSQLVTYSIRTDPRQHDKATEIIICSFERPHMRAFHASWFGFFIGFVMWFAITPLLGEVKETLGLTNAQIWETSLAGTTVTVLARVIMGPMCDMFGARRCMAVIVIVSAIPCGLTGLVNTVAGLSAVRAMVGIGGSAFVPCQYWTSRMFAREVAGTANALVAGWGNLGGGITQLLMGSVLFPLFEVFFQNHDNPQELAWRTVFVVPALIAFAAAYVYLYQCDDSPKGDFADLVRQQQIEIVSPFWSLGMAIQNRNVLLLLAQYACCFGVEITMTNATALYMKDEFGLDTASAAAVASIFGIMNLFARGLGGYGSDYLNSRYGTKGRVCWQSLTLFMEGSGIILFSFCTKLVAAIFALSFLSLWVQASEGATYGIVPYVNRRFTGAVVGWVGAGGTLGGVIFSIFFRELSYQKAFIAMGLAAVASSFLSIFMNTKSLNAIYKEKMRAKHIKNNNNFVFHDDAPSFLRQRQ